MSHIGQPCARCTRTLRSPQAKELAPGEARHADHGRCTSCRGVERRYASLVRGTLRPGRPRILDNYVDDMAIERAITGDVLNLNTAERVEITRVLTARGWSCRRIAIHLRTTLRSVQRWRAMARESKPAAA